MQEIPIDNKIEDFQYHLEKNKRIIFSAQFGDGKTYFLKKMQENLAQEYYFITLHPVNYSVARNEDIFEYIKRDILLQLAKEGMLNSIDFEAAVDSMFNYDNLREVMSFLFSFVPGGKLYDKLLNGAETFKKKYDEKKNTLAKFELDFINQRGGLYEQDAYTKLIENSIDHIKNPIEEKEKKMPVLIIEDLDRIDPGHLFRILNVLGAHIDEDKDTNKFGFDNIVVVLDYGMAEHLFYHFYGHEANYSGYMSKFMSHYPFDYSIKRIAENYLYNYIDKECNLPRKITESLIVTHNTALVSGSFATVLAKKSVRDMVQMLDGIEEQYCDEIINIRDDCKIRTSAPIVKLLALLKRMDVDFKPSELMRFLQDSCCIEILNLFGGFMMIEPTLHHGIVFFNEKIGMIVLRPDDIVTCDFVNTRNGLSIEAKVTDIMGKAFEKALEYVKDLNP